MSNVRSITPLPPANFTPELSNYKQLQPFRYWCQKVLPLVYDDSLSYYELLCKVVDYLNKTMEDVETLHGDVTNLNTAYVKLQSYVNNYFSTLDVQEEINNKLDNMASSGELYEIIRRYTDPIVNEQNDKINVLKARMDTFASLPEGSTSGNAELTDIRVGYDGEVYHSAGDAVRGQVSELKSDIRDIADMGSKPVTVFSLADFSKGAVTDNATFNNPSQTSSNQFKYIKFTDFLEDKDPFITVYAGANHLLAYISLFDASNNQVWASNGWLEVTSGAFNYLKKSVANHYSAKTLAITIIVSTTTVASGRIDIPDSTVFTTYYNEAIPIVQNVKNLENGTGELVIVGGASYYQTIQSAIDASKDGDTILIMPGIYKEALEMFGKERHLIGVDKDTCIIYSGSGLYDYPAIEANIGSIRNLTIISGNDNSLSEDSAIAKSYAIHVEYHNLSEYSLNIENCIIKSALHAAIGMGVRYNQHVNISNCYIETECSNTYSYATESFIHSAPILFHNDTAGSDKGGNGSLHISQCELVGKSTVVMVRSIDNGNNLTVRFDRNLGYYTNVSGQVVGYWGSTPPIDSDHFAGSDVYFDKHSFGNNASVLNYNA